jgi:hydroxymethylpyrimidine pyrophosphatase-like HAD family hydrolase
VSAPVVVTDLDGTLWPVDLVVRPGVRAAVDTLADAGVPVLVATARRVRGARELLRDNGLALPVVGLNGAIGEAVDGTRFHDARFGPGDAATALAAFTDFGLEPCLYVDEPEVDVLLPPLPSTNPGHLEYLAPVSRTVPDLAAQVRTRAIYSFSVLGRPPADLTGTVEALDDAGIPYDFAPEPQWPGWSVNAMPAGVSKWSGVLAYCAAAGISSDGVVAVGDGTNDLEMLGAAARPLVVSGSRAADRLPGAERIEPPEDEGWAAIPRLLGL